jgi:hypothetical protein
VVDGVFAVDTGPFRFTVTDIAIDISDAVSIQTWTRCAGVDLVVAVGSSEARQTGTCVAINTIRALAVDARVRLALIDIYITGSSSPSRFAVTTPSVDEVSTLAISTWRRRALINVCFTFRANESRWTVTSVRVRRVVAGGTILTVVVLALVLISRLAADLNVSLRVVVSLDVAVNESIGVQCWRLRYEEHSWSAWLRDDHLVIELGARVSCPRREEPRLTSSRFELYSGAIFRDLYLAVLVATWRQTTTSGRVL